MVHKHIFQKMLHLSCTFCDCTGSSSIYINTNAAKLERCVWGEVQLAVVGRADAANGRQTWRHMTEGLSVDCAPDASPSRASHGVANRWSSFHIEKVPQTHLPPSFHSIPSVFHVRLTPRCHRGCCFDLTTAPASLPLGRLVFWALMIHGSLHGRDRAPGHTRSDFASCARDIP